MTSTDFCGIIKAEKQKIFIKKMASQACRKSKTVKNCHAFNIRLVAVLLALSAVSSMLVAYAPNNEMVSEPTATTIEATETATEPQTKPTEAEPSETTEETEMPTEPKQTLEEFMDSIEDRETYAFYNKLYSIYDFDAFNELTEIPHYFQTLYDIPFSSGTIRNSGCGISSLSMVYSYLSDTETTPDMMLKYDCGNNPAAAMEKGIRSLDLNCDTYNGWENYKDVIWEAVDAGHPIILRVGSGSIFCDCGHFVVLAGKTEDGKYIVNDPYLRNYYRPEMIDKFMYGFTKQEIIQGLNGIYIFDAKVDYQASLSETTENNE